MKKYKIGYTTGVFDMFHIGHLNILKRAKEMCEHLIVGVSTDDLVESYKGKRPMIPLADRMEIIKAIRYVDEVYVQETLDKYKAYEDLGFQVIFHGDDWKNSSLYDDIKNKLEAKGVDLVFFKHTDGISSTELREKIKKG